MDRIEDRLLSMISHQVRRYLGNIKGIFIVIDASEPEEAAFAEMKGVLRESIECLEESIRRMEKELKDKIGAKTDCAN